MTTPRETTVPTPQDAPSRLRRFVLAQESSYKGAISELRRGRKRGHWMWYIFPQLAGLGISPASQKYALRSLDEAAAYLAHPILGPRLLECCRTLLALPENNPTAMLGTPDDIKLRSCATLFAQLPDAPADFRQLLAKFYAGHQDQRTLELLQHPLGPLGVHESGEGG